MVHACPAPVSRSYAVRVGKFITSIGFLDCSRDVVVIISDDENNDPVAETSRQRVRSRGYCLVLHT